MAGKNARRRAAQAISDTRLHSGMSGNGGRAAPVNGRPSLPADRTSRHARRDIPYRIAGTTAGQWSTDVSHNTTRLYRTER